jgi:hypothetical protein
MDTNFVILKFIKVRVVDEIIHEAAGLSPTASPPEQK